MRTEASMRVLATAFHKASWHCSLLLQSTVAPACAPALEGFRLILKWLLVDLICISLALLKSIVLHTLAHTGHMTSIFDKVQAFLEVYKGFIRDNSFLLKSLPFHHFL